ncbi:enoyl-CoA hydratase [Tropicimonas isoalkanivorans]|uniref:Enoyl-CoA hydratase/carnithine racemase n=1 Tax=Tropicimonas isoalkanivorans TaxID=441112 RepID=A0A1I1HS33_9RHOB|nr:enoyl-CoA hydratase [Tropicimonas isoalkanivorans]SFC26676.1 Enoyl-CoA hydratase/carnithine racemase [Tropicimonas isoalkanivorans]
MTYETILYEARNRVATITLNRPEAMNSLNDEIVAELHDAMWRADGDREVRAIILTGAGRAFCAGGDINGFGDIDPKALLTKLPRAFDIDARPDYQTRHTYFARIRKPVIGMINGACAGLGMVYALMCDVRLASKDAVFTTAFARRGLSAEYGMAWMLARVAGHANALDLLLSARRFKGEEAKQLGVVNRAIPAAELEAETRAYAEELATWCAPGSMMRMKQLLWDVPYQNLHDHVRMANQHMIETNDSDDFREGVASWKEKRPPDFAGVEDLE